MDCHNDDTFCKGWLRVQDAKGKDKLLVGQTGGEVAVSSTSSYLSLQKKIIAIIGINQDHQEVDQSNGKASLKLKLKLKVS